jgi:hypothetical protein
MRRWLLSLFGPRCDFGTAVGTGCWRAAVGNVTHAAPGWSRTLRFCDQHVRPVMADPSLDAAPSDTEGR